MMKKTGRNFAPEGVTSLADYKQALGVLLPSLTPTHFKMLRHHYRHPDLTPADLARAMGWDNNPSSTANLHYGRLGRLLAEHLQHREKGLQTVHFLADFERSDGHWHWIMWQYLARALEAAGTVDKHPVGSEDPELMPGEMPENVKLKEGEVCRVSVDRHERNREARRLCLKQWGYSCKVCGFNFKETYGLKEDFIHVHHIRPLAKTTKERIVDPVEDLRPVCANCHAAIHLNTPPYSIDKLKQMLKRC